MNDFRVLNAIDLKRPDGPTRLLVTVPRLPVGTALRDLFKAGLKYLDMHGSSRTVRLSFTHECLKSKPLDEHEAIIKENGRWIVNSKQLLETLVKENVELYVNILSVSMVRADKEHLKIGLERTSKIEGILVYRLGSMLLIENPEWIG